MAPFLLIFLYSRIARTINPMHPPHPDYFYAHLDKLLEDLCFWKVGRQVPYIPVGCSTSARTISSG